MSEFKRLNEHLKLFFPRRRPTGSPDRRNSLNFSKIYHLAHLLLVSPFLTHRFYSETKIFRPTFANLGSTGVYLLDRELEDSKSERICL